MDFGEARAAGVFAMAADLSTFAVTGAVSSARLTALPLAVLLTAAAGDRCCDTVWAASPLRGLAA